MKKLLILLLLISFIVNQEIKCQPNEALDEQTQKCEKVCEEGKVFNSNTLSCELNSANTTCPEGQIFSNDTSSYEDKKFKRQISVQNSYFTILTTEVKVNNYVSVEVHLVDENGSAMSQSKIYELVGNVTVKAVDSQGKEVFQFSSYQVTSNNAIKYQSKVTVGGEFKIVAYYKEEEIQCKGSNSSFKITVAQYSLKHSILKIILDKSIIMESGEEITIDNANQYPRFSLELKTESGEKTTYSADSQFSLTITKGSATYSFEESRGEGYIQFSYNQNNEKVFKTMSGECTLTLTSGSQSVSWTVILLGDGDEYSEDEHYDLSKTYIEPKNAVAVAGETIEINMQLRGKDGKRWNGVEWGFQWQLTIENSYGIKENQGIKWEFVVYNNNYGNVILKLTQDAITDKGDNVLTIKYKDNSYTFDTKINLKVKSGEFKTLRAVDKEAIEGDVVNPPYIRFEPIDAKGNLVTDFFDGTVTKEYLNSLTVGTSSEGVSLTANNYVSENRYFIVQYKSTISTNVVVTSKFFSETYSYRIKSGPIDLENSYAEMATRESRSSGNYKILIYPRDKYMNYIDNLSETHMKQFLTYYQKVEENKEETVSTCKLVAGHSSAINITFGGSESATDDKEVEYNSIQCSTPIDYIGNIAFHVKYTSTEIECKNCVFSVIFTEFDWSNTKTYYTNKEYYLDVQKVNEVEAKKEPIFHVTFYDQHKNVLDETQIEKLNLETKFEGADIKFCVNNSRNKKVITLCQPTGGNDNFNKWQYITNGENYKLTIKQKEVDENSFTYKIKIIGGGTGSSEAADYSKTNFNPTKIEVIAGEEGQTTMEIRTAKGERKNYWFPIISEKIKVAFDQDQDSCSYKVDKGNSPGQYVIKVTCTKENENNGFSVTVEGNKVEQKVTLVVNSGKAYYLQVVEPGIFNVVSEQYTWKVNPTNDDTIDFSFKFLDKNKNEITHSVIDKGEITISSDKFGTTQTYYKFEYNESKNTYTLTDNIQQAITKHVWTITVVESGKKYTFVYTRLPGKVDVTKSSYTIDKKDYILNEKSTVVVTLRDKYEVNIATEEGRLVKEEKSTKVTTSESKEKKYTSEVQKETIKYTYTYTVIGKYEVVVTYDGQQIKEKTDVSVSYQSVDTKKSKLYYDKGDNSEIFMSTTSETNIDNLHYTPYYKFCLYTSAGEKITVYDKSVKVTCIMNMVLNEDEKWELDVSQGDGFYKFFYKDGNPILSKLLGVSYNLIITYNGENIVYPLLFLGEKDVSPDRNYDLTNTYIESTYKEGIAGVQYEFNIEFRAKDKLRWNYEVNLGSLVITNSYKLEDKNLIINKLLGEKEGQMRLLIIQYVSYTSYGKDNVLSLTYDNKAITQKITLHIKHAELLKLEYVSGAKDGTVVNPSIIKFIPKDAYDNLYTDLFDEKVYTKTKLEELTTGKSVEKYDVTTNNFVSEGKYLNVQYSCKKVTTIRVTVEITKEIYTYKLWSGPIEAEHSYAQLEKTEGVKAGDQSILDVYPRDVYDNIVTNVTSNELSKFEVNYEVNKETKTEVTKTCNVNSMKDDHFSCQTTITKSGKIEFIVDYDNSNVNCKQCSLDITPDKLDFDKTKVIYTNENTELSRTELNTLTVTVVPNFELYFYDNYENQIEDKTEVSKLDVTIDLVVTDVKLCVTNTNVTKTSTLCKVENNENERKWSYVPNGENYQLIFKETTTNKEVTYKIKITEGFSDGDSGPLDTSKTYITPTKLTLTAGVKGSVQLELRTTEGKHKNYWYEKAEDNISVKFPDDVKDCKYSLAQAEKPGQYQIKYSCTIKRDAFKTTVSVEGKELTEKVTITVVPSEPTKSKLYKMSGEEITQQDLETVSVEDKFQMIEKLFDKYDNLITNVKEYDTTKLGLKVASYEDSKLKKEITSTTQPNGDIIITITSQFAYKHATVGKYYPEKYYNITFTHGVADASNSRYKVNKDEIFVGEEVKVYIYAYDKYNNYIDANEFKETSPYQVKYKTEKGKALKVFTEKYSIENKDGKNVLSYPGTFFIEGTSTVLAYIDTKPIICEQCRVNVKTKEIISDSLCPGDNINYGNCIDCLYNIIMNNENSNNDTNIIMDIQNAIINHKLDKCIDKIIIKENKDLLFKYNKIIYQLTSSYNQNNNIYDNLSIIDFGEYERILRLTSSYEKNYNIYNLSSINIGECEKQLRKNNNLDNNTLLMLKLDIFEKGLLIPIIEYEVYNSKTKEQIELNACKNIKINLSIPVTIDENNIFQYNSSHEYYNDICYPYSKNNADIILKDRRDEYINNNLSLCEKDCEYNNYDYNIKKVSCQCFTKIKIPLLSEIAINKDKLERNFIDIKSISNIEILKCVKEAFDKKRLILNLGFLIMSIIILIILILSILFKIKGYPNLKNRIYDIIINKKKNKKDIIKNNIKNNPNKKGKGKRKRKRKINLMLKNDEKFSKSEKSSKANMIPKPLDTQLINNNNSTPSKVNYNDYELNNLSYNEALKIDKRIFSQYYLSLLRTNHILIFSFYTSTDYNSKLIKIILFLFSFCLYFTTNALFFNDATIHKIYEDKGEYNFIYQIPIILYSTIISSLINNIVKYLSLTETNIINLKKKNIMKKKIKKIKYLIIYL